MLFAADVPDLSMMRLAVYLVGLVLVLAAVWLLLTQTAIAAFIPMTLIVVAMLLILGFGVMRGAEAPPPAVMGGPGVVEERVVEERPVYRRRWW
jgi:multisubunit Na+/H+ antiporter MnhC subunit